jgi:ribose transport system permease protein
MTRQSSSELTGASAAHTRPAASRTGGSPGWRIRPRATSTAAKIIERYLVLIAWGVLVLIFGVVEPSTFLTSNNLATIFGSQAVLVIVALGLIVPLIAGDYDLSVGGVLTLSTMIIGVVNSEHRVSILLAILLALAVGAVIGAVNAGFILVFGIDPFIVTLGTGTVALGITLFISQSQTIAGISPALVNAVVVNRLFGIPLEFYYGLGLCVVIWYVLRFTALGPRLLAVGRGREVARLSGINVARIRLGALITSGFFAAGAGIVYAGTTGSADPTSGSSYLLPAFAAAFLGATTIVPGRFNPWGTVVSAYFLITGITGLTLLGYGSYVQDVFYGGALVLAVALSQVARGRQAQAITGG